MTTPSISTGSFRRRLTFVHAVIPVRVGSEFLDGLAAEQAGVGGLSPERESCATQLLTVTLLTVLQALRDREENRD